MQGKILSFQKETNTGLISGHDGTRYKFARADWTNDKIDPEEGLTIDFDIGDDGKKALDIIVLTDKGFVTGKKRSTAILCALFLGGFGGHHFYLGNFGLGLFYLLFCWTFIPVIFALFETIRLITMSDAEFNKRHNMQK